MAQGEVTERQDLMEIKDGIIRISAGYSAKTPDPKVRFGSHDYHAGVSIETAVGDVEDVAALLKQAEQVEIALGQQVKYAVAAQLGVEADEVSDGVILAKLNQGPTGDDKPAPRQSSGGGNRGGGYGGGGQRQQSAARNTDAPRYQVTLPDGRQATVIDQRGLKADGVYKATAPDFKEDARDGKVFWLKQKDGSLNEDVADWARNQGIEV